MLHIKSNGIMKYSTMVADILPTPDPRGQKVENQLFQNNVMMHINLRESRMQQPGCNILPADSQPPHDPRRWDQKVKLNFLQIIVMLHIRLKGITNAATRLQISCLQTLPHDPRRWDQKVKLKLFQNIVMLHIKLKGITNAATW